MLADGAWSGGADSENQAFKFSSYGWGCILADPRAGNVSMLTCALLRDHDSDECGRSRVRKTGVHRGGLGAK